MVRTRKRKYGDSDSEVEDSELPDTESNERSISDEDDRESETEIDERNGIDIAKDMTKAMKSMKRKNVRGA